MTKYIKIMISFLIIIAYLLILSKQKVTKISAGTSICSEEKILICHATGAGNYNANCVAKDSTYPSGHNKHSDDIIPPYDTFLGLNWDLSHQAIWNNGCNPVTTPTPIPTQTPTPTPTPTNTPTPTPTCETTSWSCSSCLAGPSTETVCYGNKWTYCGDTYDCYFTEVRGVWTCPTTCDITSTPTPTPTNTPTPTSTPTNTPTPTPTNTPTPTSTPTNTPTPTPINTPTVTPVPTNTPSNNIGGGEPGTPPVCNDTKPGTPSNLKAKYLSNGEVLLTWDHAKEPHTSYLIAYGPSSGNYIYGNPNVGNNNNYTVKSLTSGTQYCFYVQAQNGCMPGDKSNEVCINTTSGNYNPLIDGIKNTFGGTPSQIMKELFATAEVKYSQEKLPSGNLLDENHSISIPSIGINQSVYIPQQIGDEYTVGHQEVLYTQVNHNTVYYGHNGTDIFGNLYKVAKGNKILITKNGNTGEYEVSATKFVHKSEVDAINVNSDQIVLTTCSYTQPDYRILVIASKN